MDEHHRLAAGPVGSNDFLGFVLGDARASVVMMLSFRWGRT